MRITQGILPFKLKIENPKEIITSFAGLSGGIRNDEGN